MIGTILAVAAWILVAAFFAFAIWSGTVVGRCKAAAILGTITATEAPNHSNARPAPQEGE